MMELRICILMLVLFPAVAFPQPPLRHFDQFGAINGLDAEIRDMAQDDEGFYWLATNRGLFRFDGVQATKIHLPVADSLGKRCDNAYDLCFDRKNQLIWLGTDGGLFNYNLQTGVTDVSIPKITTRKRQGNTGNPCCVC
ncbi:MAG: hypothetical protein IPM82_23850 [Saprospiraceae bacterium]|nr:hypothetical protein [Saprospiraceae bacterium]